ncbi:MAG: hypothetical protein JW795_03165 [Chitinivibrionales bacterium]|nr:hypothetical protein [Chitinivibrionales bacterium]
MAYNCLNKPSPGKATLLLMLRKSVIALILVTGINTFSAPMISVDSQDVNLGAIQQGSMQEVRYLFKIKNKGDDTLKILSVKPG